MNERKVYLYWTGKEYKLITILRKLIYLHSKSGKGYQVILITPDNIKQYITQLPDCFYDMLPAHQADFVRVNVICDYGGIWLDSDTLVMESLDSLFDLIDQKDGFFIHSVHIINGVFGSKPNTPLMLKWKNDVNQLIQEKGSNIEWAELGTTWLDKQLEEYTLIKSYKIFDGPQNMFPVKRCKNVLEFVIKPYDNYKTIIRPYQPLIIFTNRLYKALEEVLLEDIVNGKEMPLNYFFNKSVENFNKLQGKK